MSMVWTEEFGYLTEQEIKDIEDRRANEKKLMDSLTPQQKKELDDRLMSQLENL